MKLKNGLDKERKKFIQNKFLDSFHRNSFTFYGIIKCKKGGVVMSERDDITKNKNDTTKVVIHRSGAPSIRACGINYVLVDPDNPLLGRKTISQTYNFPQIGSVRFVDRTIHEKALRAAKSARLKQLRECESLTK